MCAQYLKKSYWHEVDDEPNEWITIPMLVDLHASERPDHEAFVVRIKGSIRDSITNKELKEQSELIAAGLLRMGLMPGDFVILTGDTCLNWILFDIACVSIGVIPIRSMMSVLSREGIEIICNRNNVKALFFNPGENGDFENHLRKCIPSLFTGTACENIPSLRYLVSMKTNVVDRFISCKEKIIKDITNLENVYERKASVNPDDICAVFMSSGSTGFPKAIPYSHYNLLNMFRKSRCLRSALDHDNRLLNDRSLSWMGSFFHGALAYDITTVFVSPLTNASSEDIDFCFQVIHEEGINCAIILQYLVDDIWARVESGKNYIHLRFILTGGEVIQRATVQIFSQFCDQVFIGYATTECGMLATNIKGDDYDTLVQYAGFVEKGVEIKIVDNDGQIVPMGQPGEIVIRTPFTFNGYLQKESKGMTRDENRWIKTDDAGCLENGYVKVFGRKCHVISRGILLTYPAEVEKIIINIEGVSKVAVIGVPDKRLGQNICACIIPKDGMPLTKEQMKEYFDNFYKTDEGLGVTPAFFMFMDEFPTINGKINRKLLTQKAIKEFSLEKVPF